MGCLSKEGQYPSTSPPTYQIIKVPNANHMSMMKTSLTIFPCVPGSALPYIRVCPGLSFATKRIGPPCCTLFTFVTCCSLRESWIRGCSDSWTIPLAGLLDYEDIRLKTSSHVRMGLSLAWKASLAIRICRYPPIVTDSVQP